MKGKRVGVLMGGHSAEREVSLRTGEGVAEALSSRGYDVAKVVLGDAGRGYDEQIREAGIDVAFIALHGRGGEDGCVQGLLELLGIPYTGSSVLGSALAMDKLKAKEMFRLHNVPTPPYYVAEREHLDEIEELHNCFGFPAIVKPRGEGSSVGLTKAHDMSELRAGIELALEHDHSALVERFIQAREIHVGLLDGRVLGAIEVVPKSGLYDYKSKYTPGATEYICPPEMAATRVRGVMKLRGLLAMASKTATPRLGCPRRNPSLETARGEFLKWARLRASRFSCRWQNSRNSTHAPGFRAPRGITTTSRL